MKIWPEHPSTTEVESVVRGYVGLVRAGRVDDAVRLVDHASARHVLASLWRAAAEAVTDPDDPIHRLGAGWEQDLSWLGEIGITDGIVERDGWSSQCGCHLPGDAHRTRAVVLGQAHRVRLGRRGTGHLVVKLRCRA